MAVAIKVISANTQPSGGVGVVGVNGARGLKTAALDSKHTLEPSVLSSLYIDQPISKINNSLNTRYDDPRYYSGDAPG